MLKVKFMQYKNVIIMEVLEQSMEDYENLSEYPFRASNGFVLECEDYPEIITTDKVYLKGRKSENNIACCDFTTEEFAKNFVEQASLAIKEYNKKYREKANNENNENNYFNTTIAE